MEDAQPDQAGSQLLQITAGRLMADAMVVSSLSLSRNERSYCPRALLITEEIEMNAKSQ